MIDTVAPVNDVAWDPSGRLVAVGDRGLVVLDVLSAADTRAPRLPAG